jgi:hypothetical protein
MTAHALVNLSNSTPTLLSPYGTHSGLDFTVQNVNVSGYIYLGGSTVSSTNYGFRLEPNQAISVELGGRDSIYAIASAPSMKAAVLSVLLETGS